MHGGERVLDYAVLGAGPAGLQLGYFLAQAGRDYLILEAGPGPGTFFRTFPRHRRLLSASRAPGADADPEAHLRRDWNSLLSDDPGLRLHRYSESEFPTADDLVRYLGDYERRLGLAVRHGTRVVRVSRPELFELEDAEGRLVRARRLIVATGLGQPYLPPIPGIELAETYGEVSVDPADFAGLRVLILGKGSSAFETAERLAGTAARLYVASPHPVNLAWKTPFEEHLRAVHASVLAACPAQLEGAVLDATVEGIERRGEGLAVRLRHSAGGEREEIACDRVIACTGFRFDAAPFDASCRPALVIDQRFPEQTSAWESVNVPDLYFAGTLMQMRDWKRTTSGFIHAFRHNVRALARICDVRYHGRPWPSRPVAVTPEALASALLARVRHGPALAQQFGFLCDAVSLPAEDGPALYCQELPLAYLHEHGLPVAAGAAAGTAEYLTLTLEFGRLDGDPFAPAIRPASGRTRESVSLHPVVRRFARGRQVSEHHVPEDPHGEWSDPRAHTAPLVGYLQGIRREPPLALLAS